MTLIPLSEPHLGGNELEYLQQCVRSNFVSSVGPFVTRFESEFASYVGAREAVACASGTSALHVALLLAGAKPGALVATSTFTFIAAANAAAYTGADLLLVDSEPRTWNLDGALLYDEVVQRARRGARIPDIIEVVHVLGHPADLEPLLALREEFGIRLVEDAAEALGATYRTGPLAGRHVGTVGDFGCFSFNGNKIMTTGGGGMIVTADPATTARARHLTTQARVPGVDYLHDEVGFNYRLTNVAAALGVAQLEQLPEFLRARRGHAAHYAEALKGLSVTPAPAAQWADSSFWLYSIQLDRAHDHKTLVQQLAEEGVQARPLWPPLHRQAPYSACDRLGGDVADSLFRHGLSLPSSSTLTPDDRQRVVQALAGALKQPPAASV